MAKRKKKNIASPTMVGPIEYDYYTDTIKYAKDRLRTYHELRRLNLPIPLDLLEECAGYERRDTPTN
jgi:hypothetical protein